MIAIAQPQVGPEEVEAVTEVLLSGRLSGVKVVQDLENEFAATVSGTNEAVAVSSGTAALHLALMALDIGPGHEVITTPFTFQATANMVLAVGARPVFVDVGEDGNIDPQLIEAAITEHTRAIIPVHLFGLMCEMEKIASIATKHGLAIIEDCAQSHGASKGGHRAGSFGTGCFSFYATKNMTSGEGGAITTNDPGLARRLRALRAHGEYERYHSAELGFNYRMTDIAAAIALRQLSKLESLTEKRRRNAAFLSRHLKGVETPALPAEPTCHVWHQYTIRATDRDGLQDALARAGIETGVYYERLLPDHKLYGDLGYGSETLPVAREAASRCLSLPVHPGLSQGDLDKIAEAVNAWSASREPARTSG